MNKVQAEIDEKANELVLRLPLDMNGTPSTSGKTMVHASTRGNAKTAVRLRDKELIVGINAYTKR